MSAYEMFVGADGRIWWQEGPDFWWCRNDGSVITSLDSLLPSGETKAEANIKILFAETGRKKLPPA